MTSSSFVVMYHDSDSYQVFDATSFDEAIFIFTRHCEGAINECKGERFDISYKNTKHAYFANFEFFDKSNYSRGVCISGNLTEDNVLELGEILDELSLSTD